MAAKTKWWACGQCGYVNHPRSQNLANSVGTLDHSRVPADINATCEQCGALNTDDNAADVAAGTRN